ncbi:MAG: hypothetical protein UT50_C0003G0015 [Candidatus Moranbacteria bacterium GW2011_GWA2_39_41]|nr:MAG: hypothetical protein UT50_C0003G0015 [Candidatus Moranbacteria bacterium GW2011_GWA2_39_41]
MMKNKKNMSDEQRHSNNLKSAQAGSFKNSASKVRNNLKAATNAISLMTYIDPFMDWLFAIALIFAIIKDILDLVNTALIAAGGIGAVLIFILTTICSLVIGFVILLTGSSGKTKLAKTIAKKVALLVGATLVEYIPGIDILPIESLVVIIIVWMTLTERKEAAEEEKAKATADRQKKSAQNPQFTTRTEQQVA